MYYAHAEPPMGLGETLSGTITQGGTTTLLNEEKLGMVHVFRAKPYTATNAVGGKQQYTGKPIVAVLLRNTSGITLLGRRFGQLSRTAGYVMTKEVDGYSTTLANQGIVLIDSYLPSTGVLDDDIFWGIVRGPATVLMPLLGSDHTADIAVNDPLVAATGTTTGATTSGRVTHYRAFNATAGETGAPHQAFRQAYACVGRAMSAKTSQETTAGETNLLLVDFSLRYW